MYLNYIILGIIIFVLILDTRFDFLRKKLDFLPEKRLHRVFLYFIYLFPLIITAFSPVKDNFNIFHSIKEYMSFYATALTITFAVYSFLETQKATDKIRIEKEEQREKERIERENKDFELREKELEAQKDHYRPIFVIEECSNSKKKIILLMKDKELFLKNIMVYANNILVDISEICINDHLKLEDKQGKKLYQMFYGATEMNNICYKPLVKSGDTITECDYDKFFISAETLIGETILFGSFAQNTTFYKYLKQNQIASFPNPYTKEINDKEAINKVWGSFNLSENNNIVPLEKFFFKESYSIRLYLNRDFNAFFKESLEAETYSDFLNSIFRNIFLSYNFSYTNEDNIYITIKNFITVIRNICSELYIDSCDIEKIERIFYNFLHINNTFKNKNLEKIPVDTREFWDEIEDYLKYSKQEKSPKYLSILHLLGNLFDIIKIDPEFNMTFHNVSSKWKSIILRIEL